MTKVAGISGKTNHSGRKTLVQKLQASWVSLNQIVQIMGHKNLQSVDNYSSLQEKQMESILCILSLTTKAATNVAQKRTWQRNPWLSIKLLQCLPLHLTWMWIPSMRISSKWNNITRFAHLWEILSATENKICIPARPCNIYYLSVEPVLTLKTLKSD